MSAISVTVHNCSSIPSAMFVYVYFFAFAKDKVSLVLHQSEALEVYLALPI